MARNSYLVNIAAGYFSKRRSWKFERNEGGGLSCIKAQYEEEDSFMKRLNLT